MKEQSSLADLRKTLQPWVSLIFLRHKKLEPKLVKQTKKAVTFHCLGWERKKKKSQNKSRRKLDNEALSHRWTLMKRKVRLTMEAVMPT